MNTSDTKHTLLNISTVVYYHIWIRKKTWSTISAINNSCLYSMFHQTQLTDIDNYDKYVIVY